MDFNSGGEGPAILQLHKWGTSEVKLDLSEFREAFISPTRELLLLLSYHCEALLLPLVKGKSVDCKDPDSCSYESLQAPISLASCSPELAGPSRSDLGESISSTSESKKMVSDNDFSLGTNFARSNNYPFVCDVNSLAWGICGDTYNQHEEASFSELLFVCGNHGVTVHAFRRCRNSSEMTKSKKGGETGKGKWVEWGPTTALTHNKEAQDDSDLCCEAFGGVDDLTMANKIGEEGPNGLCMEAGDGELTSRAPKIWLRTFLTEVETLKSDGNVWTKYPEKPSFPSSAMVVSFRIFDGNSPFVNFLPDSTSVSHKNEGCNESITDQVHNSFTKSDLSSSSISLEPNVKSNFISCGMSSSYKCSKLFSSNSHHLIGFVLTLVDPVPFNSSGVYETNWSKILLVVAKLGSCGIQWVCSVKLDESVDRGLAADWTDFGFSDNFLICLNAAGKIFFYGAITGEYIAHVDILQICGLHHQLIPEEQEKLFNEGDVAPRSVDILNNPDGGVKNKPSCQTGGLFGKRMFKRLLIASHTSVLAVIDEYGVIYVIPAGDYMPAKYHSFEKQLPHFQHLGHGILVGWEIGGADISHQSAFSNITGSHKANMSSLRIESSSFRDYVNSTELPGIQDSYQKKKRVPSESYMSGFSAASLIIDNKFSSDELPSCLVREIFLPTEKFNQDEHVYFSPFGVTRLIKKHRKEKRDCQIVHSHLYVDSAVNDDRCINIQGWEAFVGEAVGCTFQGCLYLVTEGGVSVVLPSVSVSSNFLPVEAIGYLQSSISMGAGHQFVNLFGVNVLKQPWSPWKVEILDRALLYEGPEEADQLCFENGWDLKISRIRRLQLALNYLKFEEIENSLEMLVGVNLAEEGVLRLLFAAVYLMSHKVGNDNEVSAASRLLALATCFATKMIRKYGLMQHRKDPFVLQGSRGVENSSLVSVVPNEKHNAMGNLRRLREMAHFLEIIRNLQCRLSAKVKRPGQGSVDGVGKLSLVDSNLSQDNLEFSIHPTGALSLETSNQHELSIAKSDVDLNNAEKLALIHMESFNSKAYSDSATGVSVLLSEGKALGRNFFPVENPKDMIARWEIDNLDLKTIVKDALLSGRLPLAVLQLHLHRMTDLVIDKEPHDTFTEVRDVGRAIAYDLFLEGEIELAVATLHKLGEDIDTSLKQLAFGTVRRSLRMQIAEEMKKYGYLGPYEWKILERISLIERAYPCSSFWRTFNHRQNEFMRVSSIDSEGEVNLCLSHSHFSKDLIIKCGEIDGVVLGAWENVNEHSVVPVSDEDNSHAAYWAAAAIWFDAWDQKTIDRIMLDQPFCMDVDVLWESRLEYHICHNDWVEVSKLLDMIPSSSSSDGVLQISLDGLQSVSPGCSTESPDYRNYICPLEDLDSVCMDVPDVRIFMFSANNMCSLWLRTLMEQQLATKFIFLKEFWEGTAEIVPLLAQSGFISSRHKASFLDEFGESPSGMNLPNTSEASHLSTIGALHKLIVHHSVQYNLPNLLDLYLDQHKLALDKDSLSGLLRSARDSQWAKWLLLSRVKGLEYDSSFCNARSITSRNLVPGNNLSLLEIDDIVRTVDDIAEEGEMAALATLMYAPVPIQDCLSSGTVNRHSSSSAQCTLENLRPALQHFPPTLWRTLVAACFGQDSTCNFLGPKTKNMFENSDLSDYLNWRENIFLSTGRDTSLLQMLPCWFSKAVRRLIQLYVQGPLGWQSLAGVPAGEFPLRDIDFFVNADEHAEISAISWEAAIQKHVEELYASSLEESGLGLEHHLHRGRALAAFNHLLGVRVQKLKLENTHRGQSGTSVHGQTNVQADVQTLLTPIAQSEESLLSSVVPLAIMHFGDSVLVASCAFLLELCGLSASMLRIDIAALRRISSFYKPSDYSDHYRQLSPKGSAFHSVSHEDDITDSLARALADDYLHRDSPGVIKKTGNLNAVTNRQPSRALMLVLQHLEKVSLPLLFDGKTCGSWLLSGNGDGAELRSQQKIASQHWNLVTVFCQMHQISLSTKYLALLARDNDWVGFLSEAQVGRYPFETVIQVGSKEFSDSRLRIHIVTVLKGMQSRKKASPSSISDSTEKGSETSFFDENTYIPVELFGILADCEKQKNPGKALLLKAKDMCWSILAMIASCFADVSPLSCLTVWLEITAARETSSIKVNDIASQIANNVAAAVEATNSLPASARALSFHYNRRNLKRRRLMEPVPMDSMSMDPLASTASDVCVTGSANKIAAQGIIIEEESKNQAEEHIKVSSDSGEVPVSLSKMVVVLCEQHLFLPLLRAFEIFLPSCSLLPFIRALQAFSQMRLSEASAHLGSFSARIKEEPAHIQTNLAKGQIGTSWISSTAVKAADAMLSTCPSPYEKRCLFQLLSATDFGDGGSAATNYRRLYWKINLAEPSLRIDDGLHLGNETLDDASLLTALEKNGHWEQARNWARQLEASGGPWKSAVHHVTETQAESMVAEWKEFLWDVPEERVALWGHCQTLFVRYSFPALQAGLFFLKHAEVVEKDLPSRELHEMLLLSLQWLSGMITQSTPVYPLHLLREIETRVWLLAVESEAQVKSEGDFTLASSIREPGTGKSSNIIDRTASIITKMDNHINAMRTKTSERNDARENNQTHHKISQVVDSSFSTSMGGNAKAKRRAKGLAPSRRPLMDTTEKIIDSEDGVAALYFRNDLHLQDENFRIESSFSRWEERVGPEELERAVLSLLEFGQITAAKQLQNKLSPAHIPPEFVLVDAALKLAVISTPCNKVSISMLDEEVRSIIQSYNILIDHHVVEPLEVLESLTTIFMEGSGRGLCKRIIAVVKAANVLGLSFSEAFDKQPIELLQLLSLKAQDSFEEANLLVQTHSMPAASIAQVLAESFLKGLLAAHRGGYMDSQKEEGPAPLLWRFSDFLKWAELCSSEPEIGHALMRLVITSQEIPHACEVELLILSHHFYKLSACLDGVDVLVALAATRVEAYVSEGDFPCLARLITGVGNFHALNFILGILIENGQLDLLLQKFSAAADTNTGTAEAVRGFRMAVLTTLKQFNPNDLDAFAMVYNHFDMKHETASLLESRAEQSSQQWFLRYDKDQNEDLLDSMRYFIEAAAVHSSIDAGNKTHAACARASLVSLQIRMPDFQWLNLSETNARRALVEQSRFQEALIVAEAYDLNQPSEWALVLWNQMLKPELTEQFVAEFVAVLPLHPSMLADLARFYRAEVAARGDQSQFSVWLTGGGLPAEWAKYLWRSFRCLLKRTRDLRLRLQLATVATGFSDVIDACTKALDRVPDNAGPLVLRKGHGGAYLPLM
ncbi:uncharacterized protein LOC114310657 isoform X1 [Camellia sinensis]|uniref:uncharacterized protein LOC114310657 isoform X1 n=1 Tax=Camellia sinensis TaxID=4442 RepID=UPI001036472D|nr:uncharacterized protein LOC114310657 isoform X1 [Camellia sinensis]